MRKIVPIHRRKDIISKNILERKDIMWEKIKNTFRKKKWKFLRRKQFKGKTSKACFVCKRLGHFAKNCPKKEKAAKLLEQAQIHAEDIPFSDIESLFSLDDEYSPQALAIVAYST